MTQSLQPRVVAVCRDELHRMAKARADAIRLVEGLGVEGDAHAGRTVQHRSRVARDPSQPNLRQVHLLHAELLDELREQGFDLAPGEIGENLTTRDVDLLGLPGGTRLAIGAEAVVEVTGLRNPCGQLEGVRPGLQKATLDRDEQGRLVRKAGVMAIVIAGGTVRSGDSIEIALPAGPHERLEPV